MTSEAVQPTSDRRSQWVLVAGVVAAAGALVSPFAGILALLTIAAAVWLLVKGAPRRMLLWWALGLSALSLVMLTIGSLAFALAGT